LQGQLYPGGDTKSQDKALDQAIQDNEKMVVKGVQNESRI